MAFIAAPPAAAPAVLPAAYAVAAKAKLERDRKSYRASGMSTSGSMSGLSGSGPPGR
jgi:hypothetical protein